jgi:hypothetical protein
LDSEGENGTKTPWWKNDASNYEARKVNFSSNKK